MGDATRECKTAIEIGMPFEEICDNFLLFILHEQTKVLILVIFPSHSLTTQQGMFSLEGILNINLVGVCCPQLACCIVSQ